MTTLDHCIQAFSEPETLTDSDAWYVIRTMDIYLYYYPFVTDRKSIRDTKHNSNAVDRYKWIYIIIIIIIVIVVVICRYCSVCQEHREATKMMVLWRLPPLLLIQLKRFMFRNVEYKEHKLVKPIEYPIEGLDLSKYTLEGSEGALYDLFGVLHHKGLTTGGHYIAFANNNPGSQDGEFVCLFVCLFVCVCY